SSSVEPTSSTVVTSETTESGTESSSTSFEPTSSTVVTSETTESGTESSKEDTSTTDAQTTSLEITSETSTEITESSTEDTLTTDSQTTEIVLNRFLNGRNDFSIRFRFSFSSSSRIFTRNLNVFDQSFDFFSIYRNGFISFNQRANIPSIPRPSASIRNFNFPIISPFWTNSFFDQASDILYGVYTRKETDIDFYNSIYSIINNSPARIENSFYPEIIYSITWRNLLVNSNN
ncbi:hypothetical protein BpHYR1_024290, partial [Brachionus plicatilis]